MKITFIYGAIGALLLIILGVSLPIALILLAIGWYFIAYNND